MFFFFFQAGNVDFLREECNCVLFTDPRTSLFNYFVIKNWSNDTIHIFKNYFTIVFPIFNFSKISSIQTDPKSI